MPVVVVFTKCDALQAIAYGKLKPEDKQLPREMQLAIMKGYVKEMERNNPAWEMLKARRYPPKEYVHLESKCKYLFCLSWFIPMAIEMHKFDSGCQLLLERTVAALNEEALQMLLVTAQSKNMMICIVYAVER